ncbi:unnamed protein product [Blepharisma stoltei]|uniref:PAS domain-containing protein n=1 Tax=Blepharisma stoltei TaxID=1481888 RepID=A0AAU9J8A4_9CILI|nr:unnamed protein product [Blepharisma stoltei]
MLLDLNEEIFESTEIRKLNPKKSQLEKQRIQIFKLFGKIFKPKYTKNSQMRSQITFESLLNTIVAFQMIALTWYPDMKINRWNRYSAFWWFVTYFNINNFCDILSTTDYCLYGTFSILGCCSLTILIIFLLDFARLKIPKLFILVLRALLLAWVTVLFIPSMIELAMIFKYSTFICDEIDEFSYNKDPSIMNYGLAGALFSVFFIIFLFLMSMFWTLFTGDTRHTFCDKNLAARAHSSVDLKLLAFRTILSISYVLFGSFNHYNYQIVFLIGSFSIYLQFLAKLPYYNKIENCIKTCKVFSISMAFVAILLATIFDDAGIAFMLNIFMQPVLAVINIWIVSKRASIVSCSKINFRNQYRFEQTIRHLLCDKNLENKLNVIDYFIACFNHKKMAKDKLLVIWEVNFCSFSIKDEKLARIKLTKINSVLPTLEGYVQEWKTQKIIDKRDNTSMDAHYIRYLEDLNKVRQMDSEICFELIDLWSEFSDKVPEYSKIYHLSMRSSSLLASTKEFYEKLILKYKHVELYDLYITFIENILRENDQNNVIYRLKSAISRQLNFSTSLDSKFGSNEENSGIMLVSANEDSFGFITYANEKASQILKGTMSDVIGSHLRYYIPDPYSYNHDTIMKEYFINYKTEELAHKGWFFLQNSLGSLIECGFSIKLTAFHNNAYFLVTLIPRITNRQFALVSEEGLIYSSTELFSYFIGANQPNLKNVYLSEIIPSLDITSLKIFEPILIRKNGKKFAIVHTIKKVGLTAIHRIIVVHDEKEIKLWRNGQDIDQIEYFEKVHIKDEKEEKMNQEMLSQEAADSTPNVRFEKAIAFRSLENDKSDSKDSESHRLLDETMKDNPSHLDNTEERSASNFQGSNLQNSSTTIANKSIDVLSRKLRLFQQILLICILAVISANIAVLVYIYQVTSHSSSLDVFSHMGNLMFHLVYSADLTRSIDSAKRFGIYNETRDVGYLKYTLGELKKLREFILSDYHEWSYCDSSSIVVKEEIPVWIFEPNPHIEKLNFYDEVTLFIKHGDNLVKMIETNETYSNIDTRFFNLNSFGLTFEITLKAMQGLVDCEVNRVIGIENAITSWIFIGLALLATFVGILIAYVVYMTKNYDRFWNFIKKTLKISYLDLKATYIERLSKIHGVDYESDQNQDHRRSKRPTKEIRSRIYLKYIWRLSIFLVIASSYYFILKFHLYDRCETFLINRPKLLLNLISKRTLLSRMSVFARDTASNSTLRWVPNSYAVANSQKEFTISNAEFKISINKIREKRFLNLLAEDMKNKIFEAWDSESYYLKQGTYAACNIMYIDSKFISNVGQPVISDFSNYIGNGTAIQKALWTDYDIIDQDTKDIIKNELNLLIYVTVIFSSALVLLFVFFYLPFIYTEKAVLENLKVLITIIPSSRVDLKGEKWF